MWGGASEARPQRFSFETKTLIEPILHAPRMTSHDAMVLELQSQSACRLPVRDVGLTARDTVERHQGRHPHNTELCLALA